MKLKDYIEQLKLDDTISSYIGLGKDEEVKYVQSHSYIYKTILASIPELGASTRILEIGPTPFTIFIKKSFKNYDVWALDRTNMLQERLEKAGVKLKVCDLDDCAIPFEDEYFDIIIFSEVLEHVFAPPSDVLKEVKRILRPTGKLILGVPNIACLSNRIKLFFGITPLSNPDNQMKKGWVHGHGHIHEYTKKELLFLCKSVDFKVTQVRMLSINPFEGVALRKRIAPIRFLYDSVLFLVPPFRTTVNIECNK